MDFDLSDEQKMLAEQARGLLAERTPYDNPRKLIDAGAEWDEPLWRELAEMGFLGANVPEAFGGLGMGELDLGVIQQELGRVNAAVPFFSSIVLAAVVPRPSPLLHLLRIPPSSRLRLLCQIPPAHPPSSWK